MSDNPLDRIPNFNRVSIRAVLVEDGEDLSEALAAAGIVDPIALPVVFGEDQPDIGFGDGITPNLTAVFETDQQEDDFDAAAGHPSSPPESDADHARPSAPVTTTLPSAYGMQPLAPVRQRN
jgi:hypothetical protein